MIISREESGDIIKGYYKSSNIALSEYNKGTKDLTITFNYGGVYKYNDVKDKDYFRFELDESQGKILNSHIKAYSFEQMDSMNKTDVKRIIKEAIEGQKKIIQTEIIDLMSQIRVDWFQNGETIINEKLMKALDIARAELAKL